MTMNGCSKPMAKAFTCGDCVTYSSGRFGPVERRADVVEQRVQRRALLGADLHGVGEEELAHPALGDEAGHLAHDLVEAGDGAQGV